MADVLTVLPSVPAAMLGSNVVMDVKAVEGLGIYASLWPGPVRCLTRISSSPDQPYFSEYDPKQLPFEVQFIDELEDAAHLLDDSAVVLAAADNHRDLDAVWMTKAPVVYIIEYTLRTRLQILSVADADRMAKLKSAVWTTGMEIKRRNALKAARGLQANGLPAYKAYSKLSPLPLLYYDSRLGAGESATAEDIARKRQAILSRSPIRLAFSGRLERMKGADYLIPLAKALRDRGVPFTLAIFGEGELRAEMEAMAARVGVADLVTFHGPVDFSETLVPALKSDVDLFVCCHMQGDPSCTYLETIGCGVPIAGFANSAWQGVLQLGPCGVATRMGDTQGLADCISSLADDRARLAELIDGTLRVSTGRSFEDVFARRVEHLRAASGR
jgi:glycosyltransferase involved in cell wall biosynthesis